MLSVNIFFALTYKYYFPLYSLNWQVQNITKFTGPSFFNNLILFKCIFFLRLEVFQKSLIFYWPGSIYFQWFINSTTLKNWNSSSKQRVRIIGHTALCNSTATANWHIFANPCHFVLLFSKTFCVIVASKYSFETTNQQHTAWQNVPFQELSTNHHARLQWITWQNPYKARCPYNSLITQERGYTKLLLNQLNTK